MPMILAGPDVPVGVRSSPVSHVDVYPTVMQCMGADAPEASGFSLLKKTPQRTVVSEYHASSSRAGEYMIRNGKWKYVYFVQYPDRPELFDLESDPEELRDLGTDKAHRSEARRTATASCSRCSIRKKSTAKQSGDKPSSSPRTAAGRR